MNWPTTSSRALRPDPAEIEGRARQHLARVAQLDEDEYGRLERWRSKLLDLSLRNRLLNFKHTQSTAMVLHHDLGRLEDGLATGKTFKLHSKPQMIGALSPMSEDVRQLYDDEEKLCELLDNDLDANRLHSAYPPADHAKRLKKIYRDARREMQESGVNLLHVAVGFLRWFDPNSSTTPRLAPLILLPAKLERVSATDDYKLSLTDDEALIHRRRNIGLSIFEAVARVTELEEVAKIEVAPESSPDKFSADEFSATNDAVQSFADFAQEVAPVADHPLRAIRAEVLDPDRQRSLKEQLEELAEALSPDYLWTVYCGLSAPKLLHFTPRRCPASPPGLNFGLLTLILPRDDAP